MNFYLAVLSEESGSREEANPYYSYLINAKNKAEALTILLDFFGNSEDGEYKYDLIEMKKINQDIWKS